jgi:hypothetical protein
MKVGESVITKNVKLTNKQRGIVYVSNGFASKNACVIHSLTPFLFLPFLVWALFLNVDILMHNVTKWNLSLGTTNSQKVYHYRYILRFYQWNKFVQNDGHHLLEMNQHGIFMNLVKIIKNRIASFVLPLMWRFEPEPYYFLHWIKDIMPFATKISNYPSIIVQNPMFGKNAIWCSYEQFTCN